MLRKPTVYRTIQVSPSYCLSIGPDTDESNINSQTDLNKAIERAEMALRYTSITEV
jgi:hypothetical protein